MRVFISIILGELRNDGANAQLFNYANKNVGWFFD